MNKMINVCVFAAHKHGAQLIEMHHLKTVGGKGKLGDQARQKVTLVFWTRQENRPTFFSAGCYQLSSWAQNFLQGRHMVPTQHKCSLSLHKSRSSAFFPVLHWLTKAWHNKETNKPNSTQLRPTRKYQSKIFAKIQAVQPLEAGHNCFYNSVP